MSSCSLKKDTSYTGLQQGTDVLLGARGQFRSNDPESEGLGPPVLGGEELNEGSVGVPETTDNPTAIDEGAAAFDEGAAAIDQVAAAIDRRATAIDRGAAATDRRAAAIDRQLSIKSCRYLINSCSPFIKGCSTFVDSCWIICSFWHAYISLVQFFTSQNGLAHSFTIRII